jgi:hypothetical protein
MAGSFPLPFKSLRTISGAGDKPFIVGAMFTEGYSQKAARLAASCEKFLLPYELHQVPTVHASISPRGSGDLAFTKANFVHHMLLRHKKPVLYLDVDCEFVRAPDLLAELVTSNCDFAIYNWLADNYTDMFVPVALSVGGSPPIKGRFYRFSGSVDGYSKTQLICSGLAQFYRNSLAARSLLRRWHRTIESYPGSADDQCLDYAYNNLTRLSWCGWFLKARWLPKAYARMAFWIYAEPVINHADIPYNNDHFVKIKDPRGRRQRFYLSLIKGLEVTPPLPRDVIIDTQEHLLCKVVDGQAVPIKEIQDQEFWL